MRADSVTGRIVGALARTPEEPAWLAALGGPLSERVIAALARSGASQRSLALPGADLRDADLRSANLFSADLTRSNLTSARLTDADLTDADLTDALLGDALLGDADLGDADLGGHWLAARLEGVTWSEGTQWPTGIHTQVRARSHSVRPGVYQVDPGGKESAS